MAAELFVEDAAVQGHSFGEEDKSFPEAWRSVSAIADGDNNSSGSGFDCNICLDSVEDPVVTLCGHLFCWPCIYKGLHFQSLNPDKQAQKQHNCPVCKAEVSLANLVPIYGKGQAAEPSKTRTLPNLGVVIPRRPLGPACAVDVRRCSSNTSSSHPTPQLHHRNHSHQSQLQDPQIGNYGPSQPHSPARTIQNAFDPRIGCFGEMVYARAFGNTITNLYAYPNTYDLVGSSGSRMRRRILQADKSLNRICLFLFCALILCLLLF